MVDLNAGAANNWPQSLEDGALGGRGQMGPGSKVIIVGRKRNTLRIVGCMTYAGKGTAAPII